MSKLITYAYLKVETDISQNIEVAQLDNPIKWAHDQLKFILGKRFYDELISQGTTNPTTFTTANAAFFDPYVKQFLAWVAYHDYLVKSQSYTTRTGIRVFKEENSDPASEANVNMLVKLASDKVQFYKGNQTRSDPVSKLKVNSCLFTPKNIDPK